MPSKSPSQARLMRAVAHGWKPSKIKGPTKSVAKEFVKADRRKKVQSYQFGGVTGPGMYGGALSRYRQPQGARRSGPKLRPQQMPQRGLQQRGPQQRQPMRGGLGQVGQAMMRQRGVPQSKGMPGGRIAPPPGKYPGGGNPMMGGRNPMIRQAANRNRPFMGGRGATSYMRR